MKPPGINKSLTHISEISLSLVLILLPNYVSDTKNTSTWVPVPSTSGDMLVVE